MAGIDGIDGASATVLTLAAGELAALVSALPSDRIPGPAGRPGSARRVLSLANERGTTIPMRFGIVIDSKHLVREELWSGTLVRGTTTRGDAMLRVVCLALTAGVALGTSTASGAVVTAEPSSAIVYG
jgi:hypothetical protein